MNDPAPIDLAVRRHHGLIRTSTTLDHLAHQPCEPASIIGFHLHAAGTAIENAAVRSQGIGWAKITKPLSRVSL